MGLKIMHSIEIVIMLRERKNEDYLQDAERTYSNKKDI